MKLRFTKVEGLGNDFVLFDGTSGGTPEISDAQARLWCDRHRGVGADGILLLRPTPQADAALEIWNSDGSRSEMCGNGLRCAAKQLLSRFGRPEVTIATAAGIHHCRRAADDLIWAELVGLRVGPEEAVAVGERSITGRVVALGNPHFVTRGAAIAEAALLGPAIELHSRFAPARTNVEFCSLEGTSLKVQVWERGAGLTLACGTGAGAAAAAAWADGALPKAKTQVLLPGGTAWVEPLADDRLALIGPARVAFDGEISL